MFAGWIPWKWIVCGWEPRLWKRTRSVSPSVARMTGPGAVLGGFVEQGEFEVSVRGGKTLLRALGPLRLSEVSLTQNRRVALTGLAIEATPQVEYGSPENFTVQSGDVVIRTAGKGNLLALKAEATAAPGQGTQATVTFSLEAPALAPIQRWLATYEQLINARLDRLDDYLAELQAERAEPTAHQKGSPS